MTRAALAYDDDYPTCEQTHTTFRLFHERLEPERISVLLECQPTSIQRKGETLGSAAIARISGWFLNSASQVESKDVRRHVDWLLEQLEPSARVLRQLREDGYHMDVHCYWVSAHTHGGPTLSPQQMQRLAALDLDIWFDVYFVGEPEGLQAG